MIEIQCTSCQTRYRIDERILPDETPTFKCSRCGHVFSAEPRGGAPRRESANDDGVQTETAAESKPAANKPDRDTPAAPDAAPKAASEPPQAVDDTTAQGAPEPAAAAASPQATAPPKAHDAAVDPVDDDADLVDSVAPSDDSRPAAAAQSSGGAPPRTSPESGARPAAPGRIFDEKQPRWRRDQESNGSSDSQDTLSFDFSDEARETFGGLEQPKPDDADKWEVGDTQPPPPPPRSAVRKAPSFRAVDLDDTPYEDRGADQISHEEASAAAQRLEAEFRGRSSRIHTAGFFLGVFALLLFAFGLGTLVICGAPIASAQLLSTLPVIGPSLQPPVSPAQRVALTNVQAHYATIKDNENALIISGKAENVSLGTLGAVQIGAALIGPERRLLRAQSIYCGNNLSPTMVSEMTPQELDFFEKLDGPRNFSLAPQATTPFVIVFVAPPAEATRFQLRVAKAELISASAAASTRS